MPWMNIAASVGSSLLSSSSAKKAAKRQAEAAAAAGRKIDTAFQQGRDLQMPYYTAGADALSQLMTRLPQLTASYDPNKLTQEPGYQFGLNQGQQALEGSLAAKGLTDSGAALKAASRYGTDYATTKLNDAFNRDRQTRNDAFNMLTGTAGFGERAGTNIATQGNQAAGQVAKLITGAGDAQAANDVAQGNIWGSLLNQGASLWNNRKAPGNVAPTGVYNGTDDGLYLADGGRVEPVVGTRAPRRAGGTGGMDRQAVLDALDVAWRDVPAVSPAGVGALPADPVRNPRAITDDRMRRAGVYAEGGKVCDYSGGGAVRGKSPGKADKITARLSGGEHVIDAEVVSMLGDGNSDAGHALLDELRERVRKFKRQAPADHTAPALARG
jgi:hypothetical protein